MDDLAQALSDSFSVTVQEKGCYSTDKQHPRFQLFKSKGDTNSQNARRKKYLDRQKEKRCDAQILARKIAENTLSDLDDELSDYKQEEVEDRSDRCSYFARPMKKHKVPRLMLSEWLVDVPDNLESTCYIVPCPVGKRNLVTSSQGFTTASTKFGLPVQYKFPSLLPNGNRPNCSRYQAYAYTILDCIYCPPENKYFVLDLLCWNGHPFLDCETEFRFFWLQTKFQENPEITKRSRFNKSPFELLPYFECTREGIVKAVTYFPPEQLDGLWFFHKQTHYHLGVTPLVGWLKPHMIQEVLNIEVPPEYSVKPIKKSKTKKDEPQEDKEMLDANENLWAMPAKISDKEYHSTNVEMSSIPPVQSTDVLDFDTLLADAVTSQSSTADLDLASDW